MTASMEQAFVEKVMAAAAGDAKSAAKKQAQHDALVATIKDSDEGAAADEVETKRKVLVALGAHAPRLASRPEHRPLLRAVFQSRCAARATLDALGDLFCGVVSNNATHVAGALDAVFKSASRGFLGFDGETVVAPGSVDATQLPQYATLLRLLELCPQGVAEVSAAMAANYPYCRADGLKHEAYAKLVLALCEVHGVLEPAGLQLVAERALEIDCLVEPETLAPPEGEVFELDDVDESERRTPRKVREADPDGAGAKLDDVMDGLFTYAQKRLASDSGDAFFDVLLDVFESAILKTKQSKFVQFAVFSAAASSPARCAKFARRLTLVVADEATPLVTKVPAVAYLASLVCRCSAVDAPLVALSAEALFSAAEERLEKLRTRAGRSLVDEADQQATATLLFALMQALVYVVCFRGSDLFGRSGWGARYDALADEGRWDRLLFGNALKPLDRADARVRDEFRATLKATAKFSAAFRAKVAEAARAPRRPRSTRPGDESFFFPFDPYVLPKSARHVAPVYRDWARDDDDDDDDDDGDDSSSDGDSDSESDAGGADFRKRARSFGDSPHSLSPSHMPMSLDKGSLQMPAPMSLNGDGFFPPPAPPRRDSVADDAW